MVWLKYGFENQEAFDLENLKAPSSLANEDVTPDHCKPWVEGQTKGLLLRFPYNLKLEVDLDLNGNLRFRYNGKDGGISGGGIASNFSPNHFGIATGCTLRTPANLNTYISVLPINYETPATPIEAIIETWWYPKPIFLVYQVPKRGESILFEHGAPLCRFMPIFNSSDSAERLCKEEREELCRVELAYENYRAKNPKLQWTSDSGFTFSKSYRLFSKKFS